MAKKKILLVEDSPVQIEILKRGLTNADLQIVTAENGVEGMARLRGEKVDLVLSDILMPLMDGYQLCREMKRFKEYSEVPFVFLTQLSEPEEVIRGLEAGADNYLTKPFDERFHLRKIRALLEHPVVFRHNDRTNRVEFDYEGRHFAVVADLEMALNYLLTTYENVVHQNIDCSRTREELKLLNENLDEKVKVRTLALTREIQARKLAEDRLLRRNREIARLYSIANAISGWSSLVEAIEYSLKAVMETLALDVGIVYTVEPGGEKLSLHLALGIPDEKLELLHVLKFSGGGGEAAEMPMNPKCLEAKSDPTGTVHSVLSGMGMGTVAGTPVFAGAEIEGYLFVASRTDGGFLAEDMELLGSIGRQIGILINSIRLYDSLKESNRQLHSSLEELKSSQKLLIRSEKLAALGQLSAGVAHEIKNPLNIISTAAQLMMGENHLSEEYLNTCKMILEQVNRATKITDNLRDFARERKPEMAEMEVHTFIQKIIDLVEYELRLDNVQFVKLFSPTPIFVKADRDQLAQVFLNLINNGADAMKDMQKLHGRERLREMGWKGEFTIETRHDDMWVYISFSDTGTGVPDEVRAKIFDPFFTTKAEGKGTGLGLAIALGIIESHGGTILVDSVEGKGTTFTVKLPYLPPGK